MSLVKVMFSSERQAINGLREVGLFQPLSHHLTEKRSGKRHFYQFHGAEVCWQAHKYHARHSLPHLSLTDCQPYLETPYFPCCYGHHFLDAWEPAASSQGSCSWSVLTSFLATSYIKETQAVLSLVAQAALAECYGQWSSKVVSNGLATYFIINMICHATCCLQKCHFRKITSLLTSCDG